LFFLEIPNGLAKPEEIRREKEAATKSSSILSFGTSRLRKSWKQRKLAAGMASKADDSSVIEQVRPSDGSSLNGSVSSGSDDPLLNSPTLSDVGCRTVLVDR